MRKGPTAGAEMTIGWGLKTFSRDALDKIHAATLDVLRSTGLSVACDEALDILQRGGCRVNRKTQVVKFPDHIVKQALSLCPSHVLLAGREPANDFMMGGRGIGFTTFGTGVMTEDLDIGIITAVAGSAKGIAAKWKIAELLDIEINSVNLFRSKLG